MTIERIKVLGAHSRGHYQSFLFFNFFLAIKGVIGFFIATVSSVHHHHTLDQNGKETWRDFWQ